MKSIVDNKVEFETDLDGFNEIVNAGFILHGHICPAMPLGIRAALETLSKLGIERAQNKELHVLMENGPAHAALCFSEGVQMGTSATFGKGEITRTNEGKNAFTLIDKRTGKSIRLAIKYGFFEKMMSSEFVMKRKEGIEPYDIDQSLPLKMIQNMLSAPVENIFSFGQVENLEISQTKGSFNFHQCTICQEPVYEPGIRVLNGKYVCIKCSL